MRQGVISLPLLFLGSLACLTDRLRQEIARQNHSRPAFAYDNARVSPNPTPLTLKVDWG